jgi:hypothetical protein
MNKLLDLLKQSLKAQGYEGLCSDGCGCDIEDLAPCGNCWCQCSPGYRHAVDPGKNYGFEWEIRAEKPKELL